MKTLISDVLYRETGQTPGGSRVVVTDKNGKEVPVTAISLVGDVDLYPTMTMTMRIKNGDPMDLLPLEKILWRADK